MKVTIEKITLGIACGVEKIWWNLKYSKFIKLEYVFFYLKQWFLNLIAYSNSQKVRFKILEIK